MIKFLDLHKLNQQFEAEFKVKFQSFLDKGQMYWMQSADAAAEDEWLVKVNQYLADPQSAAPTTTEDNDDVMNDSSTQVDALSNILQNLGMPPEAEGSRNVLTLADLQGAMANLESTTSTSSSAPLTELVTPAVVDDLLQNEATRQRLLQLLPEGQRTPEQLRENLLSPPIQQTLRSLTHALLPDDAGNMEGFYSVLANFQLEVASNDAAWNNNNNPIQAFLEALQAKVEKEKEEEEKQADE